jgi:hypothetical protein
MAIQQSIAVRFSELHPYAHSLSFYYPVIHFSFLFALVTFPVLYIHACTPHNAGPERFRQCWFRLLSLRSQHGRGRPLRPTFHWYDWVSHYADVQIPHLVFNSLRYGRHMFVSSKHPEAAIHAYLPRPVEIIGYIGRAASSKQSPNWTLGPYLVQTLFLLLAPALLAASIYMFLGRIILVLQAESHALMKKKWLTKVFVTGDVLSFLLQGAGELNNPQMR